MKKKAKNKKWLSFPLVMIEWVDSCSTDRWIMLEEYNPMSMKCRSIGWLINEKDGVKSLISNHCTNSEQFTGLMEIPNTAITKITRL